MRTQFFPSLSNMKLLGLFLSIKLSLLTLTHITTPNMVSAVVSQNTTIQFYKTPPKPDHKHLYTSLDS